MPRIASKNFKQADIYEIINIYYSNISDIEKSYRIYKYGFNPKELRDRIKKILSTSSEFKDVDLSILEEIFNFYSDCFKDGRLDEAKYYYGNKKFFENYDYASFIVKAFINDQDAWQIDSFFDKYGINREIWGLCKESINELNVDLYKKLQLKEQQNDRRLRSYLIMTMKEISDAIKIGHFKDGTEFSELEFWKRNPFTLVSNPLRTMNIFIETYMKDYAHGIIDYLKNIEICYFDMYKIMVSNSSGISYSTKESCSIVINDDHEMINDIYNYMIQNDIPIIKRTYSILRKMYLNGEISVAEKPKTKVKYHIVP